MTDIIFRTYDETEGENEHMFIFETHDGTREYPMRLIKYAAKEKSHDNKK